MCVSMFRTFTSISNSVGSQVFSSCLEAIIYPSVQRLAAAVKTDGESEYFEEDTLWDSFSTNFVEFLENIALPPNPQCTDIFIRHDLLSCIMRLITVRYHTSACSFYMLTYFSQVPSAAADVFAFIGTASTHHAVFMAPQAPQILQALVLKFDDYVSGRHRKGDVSQNSIWAAGKLLVAFARIQLPITADAGVWTATLQHLFASILRYSAVSQTDRASSLILTNAVTAVYRIAVINPDAVCSCLAQSQECGRLLTIMSSAPLNPRLFPVATTPAAAAADDHDLSVCGRGCVQLLSRASAAPVAMPAMQTVPPSPSPPTSSSNLQCLKITNVTTQFRIYRIS